MWSMQEFGFSMFAAIIAMDIFFPNELFIFDST